MQPTHTIPNIHTGSELSPRNRYLFEWSDTCMDKLIRLECLSVLTEHLYWLESLTHCCDHVKKMHVFALIMAREDFASVGENGKANGIGYDSNGIYLVVIHWKL
jgi:hypothetical protein